MTTKDEEFQALRAAAAARATEPAPNAPPPTPEQSRALVHELQVQRIELEIQNEELRTAQHALEDSREQLLQLFHKAPVGYLVLDDVGIVAHVNDTFCQMAGLPTEQVVGKPFVDFVESEDKGVFLARYRAVFKSPAGKTMELRVARPGGSGFFARLEGTTLTKPLGAASVAGSGQLLITVSDVTEQKRLEAQLLQAQKMESIGRLAGGVAHDFNNMLNVILGYTELTLELAPSGAVRENLVLVRQAAERSANLTRQLLAFARKQTVQPRAVDVNVAVGGVRDLLRRLLGENVTLEWRPRAGVWPVFIDPAQLDQILVNLSVNARDAIKGRGCITVETENVVLDAVFCASRVGVMAGEYVLLRVSDDGEGMDRATLAHIFEPFFTTKAQGRGTGLGLATVYGAVRQNGGFIEVESALNRGTTVSMYLPRYTGEVETAPPLRVPEGKPRTGTILLVEDEEQLLALARTTLTRQGYRVITALSGDNALDLLRKSDAPKPDLLVTDVVMPGINGQELYTRISVVVPGIRCLFMSGYPVDSVAHEGVIEGNVQFIQKPFTLQALAEKVREVLG